MTVAAMLQKVIYKLSTIRQKHVENTVCALAQRVVTLW